MLCLSTVKEFALVIAISIPNFFYLFVNKKSILRLCTSYQIHFHFTGSLIKEFQSTGSPSTKSFLYSKHSHIFNESIPDISRVACGQLAFANSRSSSVSSSKIWKSEINISLRFLFSELTLNFPSFWFLSSLNSAKCCRAQNFCQSSFILHLRDFVLDSSFKSICTKQNDLFL